ncbi:MAG: proton-conducting transporter membrane subunit [Gemmatimonadota bacterium]|nr:proton-conducting transporter membrane subunit [Gemmatimonadota bacterium]
MTWNAWLPALTLLSSLVPGLFIFGLGEERIRSRTALNMVGATLKVGLVSWIARGLLHGESYATRWSLGPGMELLLRADNLSVLFALLSAILWFVSTVYAIGYLEGSPNRSRFFGFYSVCVSSTVGVAFAGNLFTFFLFYEVLALSTYPLVVHRGTRAARRAGRIYLAYTLVGSAVLLAGILWLRALVGPVTFRPGGVLPAAAFEHGPELLAIFLLLVAGMGVKAVLVPLHGWLPVAMIAPAPVSALLHAVAVVKAGAFGLVRLVHDVFGASGIIEIGAFRVLPAIAAVTILWGSIRALSQTSLKRLLAYSTVSQLSYVALGTSLLGATAAIGGLAHLVHQGLMKITLFFCAGNLAETLGIHDLDEMDGVGRRMPWTMTAFTACALGMIGVPPMAGFASKWTLALGGVEVGEPWVVAVLVASALLNAAYFLPVLHRVWFRPPVRIPYERRGEEEGEGHIPPAVGHRILFGRRLETSWLLVLPALTTAILALGAGLFANAPFSPLAWARFVLAGGGP